MKKKYFLSALTIFSCSVLFVMSSTTRSSASSANSLFSTSLKAETAQQFSWKSRTLPNEELKVTLSDDGTLHVPTGTLHDPENLVDAVVKDPSYDSSVTVEQIRFEGPLSIIGQADYVFASNVVSDVSYKKIENLQMVDTSNVTNMKGMFAKTNGLFYLDLSNFNTSNVTDMSYMFSDMQRLSALDLSTFDTSKVTDMSHMFDRCFELASLDLSNFNTSKVQNMEWMFMSASYLSSLNVSSFDTSNVTSMIGMFYNNEQLVELDLSSFNTSKVTNMSRLFEGSTKLKKLDLTNFDTSNVTNMSAMFKDTLDLEKIDLSSFDTKQVTDMSLMFCYATSIKNLNLSNFDTSNVTTMQFMFTNTESMEEIDVTSFDTSNVTNMMDMFMFAMKIEELDLSSFNTAKVEDMSSMFHCMLNLKKLDLSNFDSSNIQNKSLMFFCDLNMEEIKLGPLFEMDGTEGLEDIPEDEIYTGKWQNLANGSYEFPAGKNMWTSQEFMENYKGKSNADTYIRQKRQTKSQIIITYIDDTTNKVLKKVSLLGDYNTVENYKTTPTISEYMSQFYELVSNDYPENGGKYGLPGTTQNYEVHLKHTYDESVETKVVSQTILYKYASGEKASEDHLAEVVFSRTVKTDKVDGFTTKSEWIPEGEARFEATPSPTIEGYTADKKIVAPVENISATSDNQVINVTYYANNEKARVLFVDDVTGESLKIVELEGEYNSTDSYRTSEDIRYYETIGYKLIENSYSTTGVVYNQAGNIQEFIVRLGHNSTTVNEEKIVRQTIRYVFSDGSKAFEPYQSKLIFTRNVIEDSVTGARVYGTWVEKNGTAFLGVISPFLAGYTADQAMINPILNVTGETNDIEIIVTYKKNSEVILQPDEGNHQYEAILPLTSSPTKNTLPQTGEAKSQGLLLSGMIILGGLAYFGKKRRESED